MKIQSINTFKNFGGIRKRTKTALKNAAKNQKSLPIFHNLLSPNKRVTDTYRYTPQSNYEQVTTVTDKKGNTELTYNSSAIQLKLLKDNMLTDVFFEKTNEDGIGKCNITKMRVLRQNNIENKTYNECSVEYNKTLTWDASSGSKVFSSQELDELDKVVLINELLKFKDSINNPEFKTHIGNMLPDFNSEANDLIEYLS